MNQKKRYMVRRAAGCAWLLELQQNEQYHPPVMLNESAGELCEWMLSSSSEKEAAARLMEVYGLERSEAERDVRQFLESLKERGIILEPEGL